MKSFLWDYLYSCIWPVFKAVSLGRGALSLLCVFTGCGWWQYCSGSRAVACVETVRDVETSSPCANPCSALSKRSRRYQHAEGYIKCSQVKMKIYPKNLKNKLGKK
eukprot:GHVL01025022.1.p1 GENE.GHVL01025022.1~~GHVL01025022.1.p1  ORF type:complete len:106 (+),score=5.31 GHVL01025022.1:257-574(+)